MRLGDWYDELLSEFKSMPNGPISQIDLAEKVKTRLADELNLFMNEKEASSASSYCGISFKKDDLLYHCR